VHLNLAFREPLVPDAQVAPVAVSARPDGAPWTAFAPAIELPPAGRGIVVCGDGDDDPEPLLALAEEAGWPVLAEPSSNARRGPCALSAYQYLLADAGFMAAHQPELIVSAGRPGLSRGQLALLRAGGTFRDGALVRHVVLAQHAGRWADPARSATEVTAAIRLGGFAGPGGERRRNSGWLADWLDADRAVAAAIDKVLDADDELSEPRLARDVPAALQDGALLWAASSLPIRDLDQQLRPRSGLRILASRGASGIDGMVSSAIGAALAHQTAGGGQAVALLGDLALLHDAPGLILGPDEPRPDLCLIVINNDGGGIFSALEQAAFPGPFERVFGTPHGTAMASLAAAAAVPFRRIERVGELAGALTTSGATGAEVRCAGLAIVEVRTNRAGQAALRERLAAAAASALG
jgi:2-succinyl-5-enolpyruvyl-6-hydroxy-3-cyclohexene-1-carboxylate synthase